MTDNFVPHNILPAQIRFAQSAHKHKIGKSRVLHVLENFPAHELKTDNQFERKFYWGGKNDRGLKLEIIAVVTASYLLIIHVMPRSFRGGKDGF